MMTEILVMMMMMMIIISTLRSTMTIKTQIMGERDRQTANAQCKESVNTVRLTYARGQEKRVRRKYNLVIIKQMF